MSIDKLIVNFRGFLIACWPNIFEVLRCLDWDESPCFLEDWMQANWELMVEKQILESGQFLEPYGYSNSQKCRYASKNEKATHRIVCKKNGNEYSI